MPGVFTRIAQRVARPAPQPAPAEAAAPPPLDAAPRTEAALALARELLHSVEQFVVSTPDLDAERFLHRLRGTAAGLTSHADAATLTLYREWSTQALGAFARLQKRYIAEREDEMWRLLDLYRQFLASSDARGSDLNARLEGAFQRMREYARLDDLRAAREGLERELLETRHWIEQKEREDRERIAALQRQVHRLEAALAAVRGQAKYDVLTGIFHRGAFQDEYARMLAAGPCTLALIDVDNFKTINDTLGHLVGDRLLALIGEQLRRILRTTDVAARLGGDEFCFLTPGVACEPTAQRLAGAVARRHARLEMEERVISVLVSVSVGIAASRPGDTPESLMGRADQALLAAKRDGKGGIRIAAAP